MSSVVSALALQAMCLLASAVQSPAPTDPALQGYVPIVAPDPPRRPAYGAVPAEAGEEEQWLTALSASMDARYGALQDYAGFATAPEIRAALGILIERLQESSAFDGDGNPRRMRESLSKELTEFYDELAGIEGSLAPDQLKVRFHPERGDARSGVDSNVIYFRGAPTQVVFQQTKTDAAGDPVEVYYATPEQAFEFRAVAARANAISAALAGKVLREVATRLGEVNERWDRYLEHGFSQFPWESYLNAYLTPKWFGQSSWYSPPRDQLVFLHPELGVVTDLRSRSKASANEALFVDVLGYVHYSDEREWFWGFSGAVSMSDEELGLGIGPMLHLGSTDPASALPYLSVGLLWHDPDDGGNTAMLAVSLDFWRLLDRAGPEAIFRGALER